MRLLNYIYKASALIGLVLFLCSCASYNKQASDFYTSFTQGDYQEASKNLDHNKLLRKQRNRLLYFLEKGRTEHLLGRFEISNHFLNAADLLMEDRHKNFKDIATGTLINPMMENYRGEDFEKYMIHYYKALNYLQLGMIDDALVEARRISLRTYIQEEVKNRENKKYTQDAFSLMIQGMIYEKAGELNNAFIAYRNAVEIYMQNNESFYGTSMPMQLKKDVLRMAHANLFVEEELYYEKLFDMHLDESDRIDGGELILFWENGVAPVKTEQNLFFSLTKDGAGNFFFVDGAGLYSVPFDTGTGQSTKNFSSNAMHTFRVSIPKYNQQPPWFGNARAYINDNEFDMEPAQNINQLACATLEEKRIKDLSKTLTRLAIKKFAEEAAKPDENEKDKNKKTSMHAVSLGIKLLSLGTEKADTRNWQSLPHTIYYTRIPLQKGINQISFEVKEPTGKAKTFQFSVESGGGIYFKNICTL